MNGERFVGRRQELVALLAAIDRPAGQILLRCGDPATGKSALLAELRRRLNGAPAPARHFSLLYRPAETDTVNAILVELLEAFLQVEDLTQGHLQRPPQREPGREPGPGHRLL